MSISGLTNLFTNPTTKSLNSPSISTNKVTKSNANNVGGSKVRMVLSRTRGCEAEEEIDNLGGSNLMVHGRFSAPLKPNGSSLSTTLSPPKRSKEDEERQNYYVNMGYAIRCLREEFPQLFNKELSFDIYRDDIVFKDPVNTFAGIENYKSVFWALRFHGRMFFKALWIDIVSVWQPMESVILVRWTVRGIPRIWDSHSRFDGISEYKLDKNGKIYEHRVDNIVIDSPRKFRVLSVEELIQSIGCPSTAKPSCYVISLPSIRNLVPFMVALAWLLQYLNSEGDLSLLDGWESSQGP